MTPTARRMARGLGCGLLLLAGAAGDAWAFGFNVEPARIEVSVPAGGRRGKTVTVYNSRPDQAIHLTVYVRDVVHSPDGTQDFPDPGTTNLSCAAWIQIVPAELDIPPGGSRQVRVSINAPADAKGGHYAMLFFETGPSYDEPGIGVNFRVGAFVEVRVPNTETYDAKLVNLSLLHPNEAAVELANTGNILIRPTGKIKAFDAEGHRKAQFEFNPQRLGVLPNSQRTFSVTFDPPLPKDARRLRIELDYGTKYLLVGELPLEIHD